MELGCVVGIAHLDPYRIRRRRVVAGARRAAERQVLEREAQRLGVREASFEEVQAGLERCELVVFELERGKEVPLGPERVELLARVLVPLRIERDAERDELGAIGVEAPRERLVAHLLVALDVRLDVPRRQGTALGHQEGHERELTNQLVGVVAHRALRAYSSQSQERSKSRRPRQAAARACSRCWWDGQ